MLASVGLSSVRTAMRDQGDQIVAVAPPRRPLQHGLIDKAVARQPAHRAGQRRAGPRAAVGPARSFPGEGAGHHLPGIRRPHRPHLGQDVVGDAQHVGIAPGLAGAVNRADHRLGAEPETRIAADPPALPAAFRPAFVRSRIRARSNSATAPRICRVNRPCGLVVSIGSPSERNPAPRASSVSMISSRWARERASRSIRTTTRTSPRPHRSRARFSSGGRGRRRSRVRAGWSGSRPPQGVDLRIGRLLVGGDAGVADQRHGCSRRKSCAGSLSGYFTKLAAASNRPFGKICGRRGGGEGGCAPCCRLGSPTGTRPAARPLRRPEAAGCRAPNRSRDGPRPEALFLEKSLFFNSVRRYPASGWRAFRMNRSKQFA